MQEIWQQVGYAAGALFGALAYWRSSRADKQTRATGNGWAARIERKLDMHTRQLERQTKHTRRLESKIDQHLSDHVIGDHHHRSKDKP